MKNKKIKITHRNDMGVEAFGRQKVKEETRAAIKAMIGGVEDERLRLEDLNRRAA